MSDAVQYEAADGVATVSLDDGKVNALGPAVLEALHAAFDRAEQEGAAVLLAGRENMFSAGFDLKVFQVGGEELVRMLELGARLMHRMFSFPRPVVIGATGHAMAAGAFLLLSADRRVGKNGDYKIGLNETQIGLTLPWPVIELARYRLDRRRLDESVVNARIYSPAEAVEVGYLDVGLRRSGRDGESGSGGARRAQRRRLRRQQAPPARAADRRGRSGGRADDGRSSARCWPALAGSGE